MGEQVRDIEEVLKEIDYHKPFCCDQCGRIVKYLGVGEYLCVRCDHIMLDDYGKVRKYVTEKGGANATEIARDTGVAKDVIDEMIKNGALESSAEAEGKAKCVKCGKPISKGRYCNECIWELASQLKNSFATAKAEAQPKVEKKEKGPAKMYTFKDGKK